MEGIRHPCRGQPSRAADGHCWGSRHVPVVRPGGGGRRAVLRRPRRGRVFRVVRIGGAVVSCHLAELSTQRPGLSRKALRFGDPPRSPRPVLPGSASRSSSRRTGRGGQGAAGTRGVEARAVGRPRGGGPCPRALGGVRRRRRGVRKIGRCLLAPGGRERDRGPARTRRAWSAAQKRGGGRRGRTCRCALRERLRNTCRRLRAGRGRSWGGVLRDRCASGAGPPARLIEQVAGAPNQDSPETHNSKDIKPDGVSVRAGAHAQKEEWKSV
jgi:hypothetical protein